jgi:triosephosphate isomerase
MQKLFIVANWKSHMTLSEAHSWMIHFLHQDFSQWLRHEEKEGSKKKVIVICPPFTLLAPLAQLLKERSAKTVPIKLGAQNISPYEEGAHTGEETGEMISDFASFVIIGHSERRKEFHETDSLLGQKVQEAQASHLEPIFCVQGKTTPIPEGVTIAAYEPIAAIGSGHPDTPEDANAVAAYLKEKHDIPYMLYGGSVTADNVSAFTSQDAIDGVLVGGASLDPEKFAGIVQNA